jgi:serine/threonine protein kinase
MRTTLFLGSIMSIYNDADVYTEEYLIKAVRNIAKGMKHLHANKIIHRNLKAANILLTENRIPKITDYGLSLLLKNPDERRVNLSGIRWMSPELLASPKNFTFKSDVWAFGIVVWELVAKQKPFRDIDPLDLGIMIRDQGLKPTIPSNCPQILADIMTACWQQEPDARPDFDTIVAKLS